MSLNFDSEWCQSDVSIHNVQIPLLDKPTINTLGASFT